VTGIKVLVIKCEIVNSFSYLSMTVMASTSFGVIIICHPLATHIWCNKKSLTEEVQSLGEELLDWTEV